jgi:hypothetical protein
VPHHGWAVPGSYQQRISASAAAPSNWQTNKLAANRATAPAFQP